MVQINDAQLLGQTTEHLASAGPLAGVLHASVVEPFEELQSAAANEGFDLQIVSGFRSFERQLGIWNAKASGNRPLLDDQSKPLDLTAMPDDEIALAILRWSALPGGSRHHWGTDFDIYDASAIDSDYQIQLVPEETKGDGPFARMHRWLDEFLPATEFYRPYAEDLGGTAPEPWHLSHAPTARAYEQHLSVQTILTALDGLEIALRDSITQNINSIYQRYIANTCASR